MFIRLATGSRSSSVEGYDGSNQPKRKAVVFIKLPNNRDSSAITTAKFVGQLG